MERKHYNTAGRAKLIAYLAEHTTQTPQSAEHIYATLARMGDAPGYSSVYRLLSQLCAQGSVRRVRALAPAKGYLYQYVQEHACHTHFHLHCLSCGEITHLECDCGEEIASHLMDRHGFFTDFGRTVFYGTCAACQKQIKGGTV